MENTLHSAIIAGRRLFLHYRRSRGSEVGCPIPVEPRPPEAGWAAQVRPGSILESAKQMWGGDITLESFPVELVGPIKACVQVYSDKVARVFVSKTSTFCWQRFYAVKEICHIITGHTGNYTTITHDEVERLIYDVLNHADFTPHSSGALHAEAWAYLAAIEALLPKEHVEEAMVMLSRGDQLNTIATRFRVPARVVESRLRQTDLKHAFDHVYKSHQYQHLDFTAVIQR